MLENKGPLIFSLLITLILSVIISNNFNSILNYLNGVKKIDQIKEKLSNLTTEKANLEEKIRQTEDPDYIQKLAIDELNLTPENTTILIIPEENSKKEGPSGEPYSNDQPVGNFEKWAIFLKLSK